MRIFKPVLGARTQVLVVAKGELVYSHWEAGQSWFCPGQCELCRFLPAKELWASIIRVPNDDHEYFFEVNREVFLSGLLIGQRLWVIGSRDRNRPPTIELIDENTIRADKIAPPERLWGMIAKLYRLKRQEPEEPLVQWLPRLRHSQRERIAHAFPPLFSDRALGCGNAEENGVVHHR